MSPRLSDVLDQGLLPDGPLAVFRPAPGGRLPFDPATTQIVTGDRVAWRWWEGQGYRLALTPDPAVAAVVCLPRAKPFARALIAQAGALGGPVVVDGQKTDGIESLLKEVRKRGEVTQVLSKAHGKSFVVQDADFTDWLLPDTWSKGEWTTAPAGFSSDGPDAGSVALAEALPPLTGSVWDMGAGWGYLSAKLLAGSPKVRALTLIEAEHSSLAAARLNVTDPRASFLWADALAETPREGPEHIIMNPPFHQGRASEPGLGRSFIQAAAKALPRHGILWMVANRHLPYEATLAELFIDITDLGSDPRFKLFRAARPKALSVARNRK